MDWKLFPICCFVLYWCCSARGVLITATIQIQNLMVNQISLYRSSQNYYQQTRGLPLPLGRGVCKTKSKNGRSRPRKPFISRVFCAQRGIKTMVSEGARPWGRGRSGDSELLPAVLVTLENLFPRNFRYRYRLEILMNFHYRYRPGVRSHPFISIDSQLPSWKSVELIFPKLPLPLPSWNVFELER